GNPERGWNDPPQFSYRLQARGGGSRPTLLTRRPLPPPAGTPPGPTAAAATAPPVRRRRAGPAAGSPGRLPPRTAGGTPAPSSGSPAGRGAAACSPLRFQKQVCDDIGRRLTLLEAAWAQGKLSAPVRKSMGVLVRGEGVSVSWPVGARRGPEPPPPTGSPSLAELEQQRWDAADETHRSLMVDHVHEVSQWLVGVKRLIAEARSL
ncbi:SRA1 protein, partial [Piaya cayana]|nr:SRA1 protein [Piaya cayana]